MKSKIFIFTTLILVVFLFVITSCDNFLNAQNKTTININLDLSKILKTSRNETTTSITEYILKVFAYNAATYKPEDEIQNLPLLTQTENKVDINGNVKARLDVEIGLNVIFVAKLYQGKSEKPLYAGKSEVIKIKATDNKVHLVLTRENADLDIDILVHDHTFAEDWTSDATHHWHAATCEHKTEVSGKAEHIFTDGICVCGLPEGFILIPAGTFQMGSNQGDETNKPVHQVTITKDFYMGKYEITQAEYDGYCNYGESSPSSTYGVGNNYPAYYVSWYDALVYCNKRSMAERLTPCYRINESTDPSEWETVPTSNDDTWNAVVCDWNANGYRLPTEAEWEYAARAGDNTVDSLTYSGTSDVNKLGEYAWYKSNSDDITHEVGKKLPNAFGLYDMSGNVYEWCWNRKTGSYNTTTEGGNDPTGNSSGNSRIFRGGTWDRDSGNCAVSGRYAASNPGMRPNIVGFRVVRLATEVSGKAEHSFGNWTVTNEPTETEEGRNERTCTICGYTDSVVLQPAPAGFRFVKGTTITGTESWTPSSEVFVSARKLTMPDLIVSDHEVTRGEYTEVMGSDPSIASAYDKDGTKLTGDAVLNNPVNYVNWYDALVYCNKRSKAEGLTPCYSISDSTVPDDWGTVPTSTSSSGSRKWDAVICNWNANGYRLPTEAEWEWLARGGENYTYAGSDTVDDVAWYEGNTNDTGTREVKTKAPNGYGLYDMSGNVYECCWDWRSDSISDSTAADGAALGELRVLRGASWDSNGKYCQVVNRQNFLPYGNDYCTGFRVVRSFPSTTE